ncbi:MAG: hypothetical protein LBO04_08500 [Spirochaetaceae bacterium]|jgi:hypothetical protein|nr:hypothetical protein [Spirochaetaceae bacterium]
MGLIKSGAYPDQTSAVETQTPEISEMIQHLQRAVDIFKEVQHKHKQEVYLLQQKNKEMEVTVSQLTNEKVRLNQQVKSLTIEREYSEAKYAELERRAGQTIQEYKQKIDHWYNKYEAVSQEKENLEKRIREQRQSGIEFQDTYFSLHGNSGTFPSRTTDTDARVLNDFNTWASNPVKALPGSFRYLAGDFKIRSSNPIRECASPSKWIINKDGSTKFLFPNPNTFNEMTNISELYVTKTGVLKPKNQNQIKIIKACEISDNGFIEFPGELQLL